jgi:calcineurin-like phosphoesterase family protein
MDYFVTSDTHFGHANIIRYCNRPFRDVEHMNEVLIRNWNQRIKPDDIVYHLGDFCFKNTSNAEARGEGQNKNFRHYWDQLNGIKFLVEGNHDQNNTARTRVRSIQIYYGGFDFGLVHDPRDVNASSKLWITGHVHNNWPRLTRGEVTIVNACVDVWNFRPVKLQEIVGILSSKT